MAEKFQRDGTTGKHYRDSATGKKILAAVGAPCCCDQGCECPCEYCSACPPATVRVTFSAVSMRTDCITITSCDDSSTWYGKIVDGGVVSGGVLALTADAGQLSSNCCCWRNGAAGKIKLAWVSTPDCVGAETQEYDLELRLSRRVVGGFHGWAVHLSFNPGADLQTVLMFCGFVADEVQDDCTASRTASNSLTTHASPSDGCLKVLTGSDAVSGDCLNFNCVSVNMGKDGYAALTPL